VEIRNIKIPPKVLINYRKGTDVRDFYSPEGYWPRRASKATSEFHGIEDYLEISRWESMTHVTKQPLDLAIEMQDQMELREQQFEISIDDLFLPQPRFKPTKPLVLKIENINQIHELLKFLLKQRTDVKFLDKIEALNFKSNSDFFVNPKTADSIRLLLATITKNIHLFPNLKSLTFDYIHGDFELEKIPLASAIADVLSEFESSTLGDISNLKTSLTWLKVLTIEVLDGKITLPPLDNLHTLNINSIWHNGIFAVSEQIQNLTTLSIANIIGTLILTKSLDNLQTLTIEHIVSSATLKLPESLNNLITLSIAGVENFTLNLPKSLNKLTTLSIQTVHKGSNITFPNSLDNLASFTIENIEKGAIITLPKSLKNLSTVSISDVYIKLETSGLLDKLTSLSIKNHSYNPFKPSEKLDDLATLIIPNNLTKLTIFEINCDNASQFEDLCKELIHLKDLFIERIGDGHFNGVNFNIPDALNELSLLRIGKIHSNAILVLPHSLDSLSELTIDILHDKATLILSNSLKNLTHLRFEQSKGTIIHQPTTLINLTNFSLNLGLGFGYIDNLNTALTLLESANNLTNLSLGTVSYRTINLPDSLHKLINLHIKKLSGELNLPNSLNNLLCLNIKEYAEGASLNLSNSHTNLASFSLGALIASDLQLPSLDNLTELNIGIINNGTKLELPKKLNQLATLSIKTVCRSGTLIFPESLDNLKKLTFQMIENPEVLKSLCSIRERLDPTFIDIDIHPSDFANPSFIVNSMAKNNLNISLKIDAIEELSQLIWKDNDQKEHLREILMDRIKCIDFRGLKIDNKVFAQMNKLLEFFAANLKFCPNLKTLFLGVVEPSTVIDPDDLFSNFLSLSVEEIWDDVVFKFPESFCNLENLIIGNVWNNSQLIFPSSLNHLTTFSLGHIKQNVTIQFPDILPNVKALSFKDISNYANLKLPHSIPMLTNLVLGDVPFFVILKLSKSCPNLTTLTLSDFNSDTTLNLPDNLFPNLTHLTMGNFGSNISLAFPNSFSNLQNLNIGDIGSNVTFNFPNAYDTALSITLGNMGSNIIFSLPDSQPRPTILTTTGLPSVLKLLTSINGRNSYTVETINPILSF